MNSNMQRALQVEFGPEDPRDPDLQEDPDFPDQIQHGADSADLAEVTDTPDDPRKGAFELLHIFLVSFLSPASVHVCICIF